jgi:acyl-coenzyme A synthetase/AMP-(fatty) acid ligase
LLTYDDIPARLNLASWFLDRNLEEGRGERTALIVGDDRAYSCSRLSPHKYPRQVRFLDELPKTGQGKVDRRTLRALGGDGQGNGAAAASQQAQKAKERG